MDLYELYHSCRTGDLDRIRYLVEQKEVEVNVRDKWDSTPLYYACLCGHYDVVKYLLQHGAKCEANTFDGERCLYGALNSEIRSLLKNYKVISSQVIRRELYHEFLRRLLESGEYADICFLVHGEKFLSHKCVLRARSDYFNEMLLDKWHDRFEIPIKHELVDPAAFDALLHFLYLGRVEIHVDIIDALILLTKQCRLENLMYRIEDMVSKACFFQCTKPGTKVTTLVIESPMDKYELSSDFSILAEEALPLSLCNWVGASELPFYPEERAPFADLIFEVENQRFRCHKAFFCMRSDYFKTLLRDPFREVTTEGCVPSTSSGLPVVKIRDVSVTVFVYILYYIYQDCVQISPEHVYDVLLTADVYLLPGLKRQCGGLIGKFLDLRNVCSALRTARLFDLPRLEDKCYQFFAEHLEYMIELEEFQEIIREDANTVKKREDVDSIETIDNIRFHLTSNSMEEAHEKLMLIESLLEKLDLNA